MNPKEIVKAFFKEGPIDPSVFQTLGNRGILLDPPTVAGIRRLLTGGDPEVAGYSHFFRCLLETPCPSTVLQQTLLLMEEWAGPPTDFFPNFVGRNPDLWARAMSAGPFLGEHLRRSPERWLNISSPNHLALVLDSQSFLTHLHGRIRDYSPTDMDEFSAGIRAIFYEEILTIALHEIAQTAAVDETAKSLSVLATFLAQSSLEFLSGLENHTVPMAQHYFILGMGKLGGMELNFSSDIDVIAFYDAEHSPQPSHEAFTRLTERWIQLLTKVTEHGFVYRVDLRLRPEGSRGPLANSFDAGLRYYETWGSLWDRAAYLKARPLAGNTKMALTFLRQLEPFIFQRSIDFNLLESLFQMKQKIKESQVRKKRSAPPNAFDVKLDEGGIREIEFFVQMHQLLHGGRELALRSPSTLPTMERMVELGLLVPENAQDLREAYLFLRRLEHLLQIRENQQTHLLNPDDPGQSALPFLMGFHDMTQMQDRLEKHRENVHQTFEGLLTERPSYQQQTSPNSRILGPKGETVLRMLTQQFGESQASSPENFSLLQQWAHHLQQGMDPYPDWKRFLNPLEQFFRSLGGLPTWLNHLAQEARLSKSLLDIFFASDFLTDLLLKEPRLILRTQLSDESNDQPKDFNPLESATDRGEAMDQLRIFARKTTFDIGLDNLEDQSDPQTTSHIQRRLTTLADSVIGLAATWIDRELTQKYGCPKSNTGEIQESLILGLGSLGAQELSFTSDLDLIFIYGENGSTSGGQSISNHEFFTLFAQRLISFLSTATAKGYAYKIDTRLRPSGRGGTLVISAAAFLEYHRRSKTWEIQSLLRTRVVWGKPAFKTKVGENIQEILKQFPASPRIASDIVEMREKMVSERLEQQAIEHNPLAFDIKMSPGGLTDIEFIAQFLQLKHQCFDTTHTRSLLLKLQQMGAVTPEKMHILLATYDRYRFILHQICLRSNHAKDPLLFLGMPRLDEIARMLSFDDAKALLLALREGAQDTRKIYLEILQHSG